MEGRPVRITVNDRILVHLLDYTSAEDKVQVPQELTQRGIADVVGARRSHVSMTLGNLVEKGHVIEEAKRVEGAPRKLKAYFLTPKGYSRAVGLKEHFLRQEVTLWSRGEAERVTVADLEDRLGEEFYLVDILASVRGDGSLDLEALLGKEEALERFYAAPLLNVTCPQCASPFMVQKPEKEGAGYTICPACALQFEVETSVRRQSGPGKGGTPTPLVLAILLGLVLLVTAALAPGLVGWLWILSIAVLTLLVLAGALTSPTEAGRHRRATIALSVVLALAAATVIKTVLGGSLDPDPLLSVTLVAGPMFGVVILGRPIPVALRSEISIAAGIFLGLLGAFVAMTPGMFELGQDFSLYWMILGVAAVLVGYELHHPEKGVWGTLCLAAGAFIVAYAVVWAVRNLDGLSPARVLAVSLWAALGVHVARTRFARGEAREEGVARLKAALPYGLGIGFLVVAAVLIYRGLLMESTVEGIVGVPLLWYSMQQRPEGRAALLLFVYVAVLEVVTAYALLFGEVRF